MALSLSVAPTVEPVTLDEVKTHLHVTHMEEDDYLSTFIIPGARQIAETLTLRAFLHQTWILRLCSFGADPIVLPKPPLSSITSVQYVDNAGTTQTWSEGSSGYQLERPTGELALHGSIRPAYNQVYPTTRGIVDAVTIIFVAGYGAAATAVPVAVKLGVLQLAEQLYAGRRPEDVELPGILARLVADRYDLRFD